VARLADRIPQNVPGDFFVDASCIACDTCRRRRAPDLRRRRERHRLREAKILAFVSEWNDAAHPFAWTPASFAKVLAKVGSTIEAAA